MSKRRFVDEFDVELSSNFKEVDDDYSAFSNKVLLDELRNKIIQNLIDHNINQKGTMDEFVKTEIDNSLKGYDLSNVERNYIYNLIDNEINGYGPLTELLKDENITEIMVNSPSEIYIEIDGNLIKDESISFINDANNCITTAFNDSLPILSSSCF